MESAVAIKETKEMAVLVARLANAADASLVDGKIGLTDAVHVMSPLMTLAPALSGAGSIPKELKDLDPVEAEELKTTVAAELNLKNDGAEQVVEEVIGVSLQLAATFAAVRAAKQG